MFCYKCGFPVDEKFNFCPHCAADLSIIKNQLASPDHSVPQKEQEKKTLKQQVQFQDPKRIHRIPQKKAPDLKRQAAIQKQTEEPPSFRAGHRHREIPPLFRK